MRALRWGICVALLGVLYGGASAWQHYCSTLPKVHRRTLTKSEQERALACVVRLLPMQRDGSLKGQHATDITDCLELAKVTITYPDRTKYRLPYEGKLAENVEGAGCLIITVSRESGVVCEVEHIVADW